MKHHDLIVIGTGSGNSVIDSSMADWDIGLIDQRKAGGTCLNYGCIPTKMFAYTAEVVDMVGSADDFGVDAKLGGMRWTDVRDRVFGLTDRHSDEGREGRESASNITCYDGHAEVTGPRELTVTDEAGNRNQLTGDRIQAFVMAIELGISATDLARRPYWIHPALTEIVQNALLDVSAAA